MTDFGKSRTTEHTRTKTLFLNSSVTDEFKSEIFGGQNRFFRKIFFRPQNRFFLIKKMIFHEKIFYMKFDQENEFSRK